MPRDLLFGRLLPPQRLLAGGGDAAAGLLRVPVRRPHIPAGRGRPQGRAAGRRRKARRDIILSQRR